MPKHDGAKKELVQRVKKAVKKSRRKLGAEKFEKELTRTITFLEDLQKKVAQLVAVKATAAKKATKPAKTGAAGKAAPKSTSQKKASPKPSSAPKGKTAGTSSAKK